MTIRKIERVYNRTSTEEASRFMDTLRQGVTKGGTFDSVSAESFVGEAARASATPKKLQVVFDEIDQTSTGAAAAEAKLSIVQALEQGARVYEEMHGETVPGDLVESALHNVYSLTRASRTVLDSAAAADSNHSEPQSLQPNRAVVSILAMFSTAIPFAHYLPADIASNEAKLAIMSHKAGTTFGGYAQNDLLDGINNGEPYIGSSRVNTHAADGTATEFTGTLTAVQTDGNTCDQTAAAVKLLRGRSIVYISGLIAGEEVSSYGSGASAVSGSFTLGETAYTVSGTVNSDTGAYAITVSPALPADTEVAIEGFIDFEREPDLIPSIITGVETFRLFAKPWRAYTRHTIDTRTQMSNELGLDPHSEAMVAIQTQFANERHYDALRKGFRLAALNQETFDYSAARSHQDSTRADVWRDLSYPLGLVSQVMAEETMNHGITHLYVGKRVAAQLQSLPASLFEGSGLADRPSIYRVGRLFGKYEVYYTPKYITEDASSAQILCVGRATDVARNPLVLGDAVAPTVVPLAMKEDLRYGSGFYARNFTCVNPHQASAKGFAMINVVNME